MSDTKRLTNELLKSKMSDAMVDRGYAASFDSMLSPGIYYASEYFGATDFPPGAYKWGILEVFVSGGMVIQRYTPQHAAGSISVDLFVRTMYQNIFSAWSRFSGVIVQ